MTTYVAMVRVISDQNGGEVKAQLKQALRSAAAAGQLTGAAGVAVLDVVEDVVS